MVGLGQKLEPWIAKHKNASDDLLTSKICKKAGWRTRERQELSVNDWKSSMSENQQHHAGTSLSGQGGADGLSPLACYSVDGGRAATGPEDGTAIALC